MPGIYYESPFGCLEIQTSEGMLVSVKLITNSDEKQTSWIPDEVCFETVKQLTEYFSNERTDFDLPIHYPKASAFDKSVWECLRKIPYGQTASYSDLAQMVGSEKAVRAVGNANRKNPIAIIVPCHRCIAKNGNLHGYFYGLEKKKYLLDLENR